MLVEFVSKIAALAAPNYLKVGDLEYADKEMKLIKPPIPDVVEVTTLQGLVDLLNGKLEDAKQGPDLFVHIEDPLNVSLISRESDEFGRRQVFATAQYPKECPTFAFGTWHTAENFIIACQQGFQRATIQNDDGTFAKDLDYVISTASKISADSSVSNEDDGVTQRVNVMSGVTLKTSATLQPRVALAPFRTFAEIDQIVSTFVFRARVQNGIVQLAIFEGDGGRWRLAAVAAIKAWLANQISASPIIS
jgi:hypothetical protein